MCSPSRGQTWLKQRDRYIIIIHIYITVCFENPWPLEGFCILLSSPNFPRSPREIWGFTWKVRWLNGWRSLKRTCPKALPSWWRFFYKAVDLEWQSPTEIGGSQRAKWIKFDSSGANNNPNTPPKKKNKEVEGIQCTMYRRCFFCLHLDLL